LRDQWQPHVMIKTPTMKKDNGNTLPITNEIDVHR
jgi:hypothetical protein